jgi:hypothetical protein
MNKLTTIIIIISLFGCGDRQNKTQHSDNTFSHEYHLSDKQFYENHYSPNGQIEYSIDRTYYFNNNKLTGDIIWDSSIYITYYKYDLNGNKISELKYSYPRQVNSKPRFQILRTYSNKNIIFEKVIDNGSLITVRQDSFDSNNRCLKSLNIRGNRSKEKDKNGFYDLDKIISYDTSITLFTFTPTGDMLTSISFDNKNKLTSKTANSFVDNKMTTSLTVNNSGDTISFTNYIPSDSLIKEVKYFDDGVYDTTWRDNQRVYKKIIYFSKKSIYERTTYNYDKKGNKIEIITEQ